jgi:hypothetical protein
MGEDDVAFLKSLGVPLLKRCPQCLLRQRLAFRNERTLYKRKCDAPGHAEEIISNCPQNFGGPVYDTKFWWSDEWDPMDAGQDYDFSRPFFEQLKELIAKVPSLALFNWNGVNSDYCNFTTDNKNCYLVFGGDFNENCAYSTFNFHSKDTLDAYFVEKCELCYELIDSEACYRVRFGRYVENCSDCIFMYDSIGCTNCVGCVGLRNKSYYIFNHPYSKEEYLKEVDRLALGTRAGLLAARERFEMLRASLPQRYAHIFKSTNCTGDNILNASGVKNSFDISGPAQNLHNVFLGGWDLKDSRYADHSGHGVELMYNSMGVFSGCNRVVGSFLISSSQEVFYSWICRSSSQIFGCVGLRNKKYCILNKQYSKEEYESLMPRIIAHMDAMPYVSSTGDQYAFGDFLPPDLSQSGYNETIANEYFPLDKDGALSEGFIWREREERNYTATVSGKDLSDSIRDVSDDVLNEVIACAHDGKCGHHCTKAFRIIASELALYRRLDLPLPEVCPNCRHYERVGQRNPLRLWSRKCDCKASNHFHVGIPCSVEFETSYAPERPEIVYCEQCYQAEVV